MDHRIDLEHNRRHHELVRGKNLGRKQGTNLEEFGMEEEFNLPNKQHHPSIREKHDQFFDSE